MPGCRIAKSPPSEFSDDQLSPRPLKKVQMQGGARRAE
jgi:hypothetical protein